MRVRLLVATVALITGTLVLASVGSFLLIRRDTFSGAERQLRTQVRTIAEHPRLLTLHLDPGSASRRGPCCLRLLRVVGGYTTLSVAVVQNGEPARPLPAVLQGVALPIRRLEAGSPLTGHVGRSVYVLFPLLLTPAQRARVVPAIPAAATAFLVGTRQVATPAGGMGYFILVGAAVLAIAAAVSYVLAWRFSRPLRRAVEVTERIAGGDLEARIPADAGGPPEFAALAGAINATGEHLLGAREQQRQFLLSVSHDLRTPLTSIAGYAQALAEGAAEDVPAAVQVIRSEAQRLERLVQDLLDLARLDARRFSFHPAQTDLSGVLAETVRSFQPAAELAPVSLVLDVMPTSPVVLYTDRDRVGQLLANLVENALRFARTSVRVGARLEGTDAVLWVVDDGPGIAAPDLPRVFERHFSSDRSPARDRGTGLGLAIVAEMVSAMCGQVRADSPLTPHGGTAMVVRLPPLRAAGGGDPAREAGRA